MSMRRIAKRMMDEALNDQIRGKAARALLERVVADPRYPELDAELRAAIERFVEDGPPPTSGRPPPVEHERGVGHTRERGG